MTAVADLVREARGYLVDGRAPGRQEVPRWEDIGPVCAGCGGDEYRVGGYCSVDCRDLHELLLLIARLADALETKEVTS